MNQATEITELYGKVSEAIVGATPANIIAVFEQIKFEELRNCQMAIDSAAAAADTVTMAEAAEESKNPGSDVVAAAAIVEAAALNDAARTGTPDPMEAAANGVRAERADDSE